MIDDILIAYRFLEKLEMVDFEDIINQISNDENLKVFMTSKIKDLPENIKYSVGDSVYNRYLDKTPFDYTKDIFNYNKLGNKFKVIVSKDDNSYLGWVSFSNDISNGSLSNVKFGSFWLGNSKEHSVKRIQFIKELKEFFDGMLENKVDIYFVANKNNPFVKHYYNYLKKYGGDAEEIEDDNVIFRLSNRKYEKCIEASKYLTNLKENILKGNSMTVKDRLYETIYKFKIALEPEGIVRLTNIDKLKFATKEEADAKLEELNNRLGDKLEQRGVKLIIKEIERKPRATKEADPDFNNPFEVGDILCGNVGYTQVLPEFWEVIKKSDHYVTCRRLKDIVVDDDGYGQSGTMKAIAGKYQTNWGGEYEEIRMKVEKNRYMPGSEKENYYACLRQRYCFYIWDGEPKQFDMYD